VSPYYDSMIGKLVVHGDTRDEAVTRMQRALGEFLVQGVRTNMAMHQALLAQAEVKAGGVDNHFLERWLAVRECQ
jgi:acetyl-CoA carboxylase, biotin carboxylase subunit